MKKPGIIFDCDGTLVRSLDLGMGSYNYALEKIGERFREPEEIKKFFGSAADRIFLKLLGDEEKALKAFDYYFEHESKQVSKVLLHEGIENLLDDLKTAGYSLGVVTGRHYKDLDLIFSHHKLTHYFDAIICDNHIPHSKPAPDGILLAASKMAIPVSETFYIGDSVMDMKAARNADSKGIAALWDNWVKPLEMLREGPVLMAKTPDEVISYLSSL